MRFPDALLTRLQRQLCPIAFRLQSGGKQQGQLRLDRPGSRRNQFDFQRQCPPRNRDRRRNNPHHASGNLNPVRAGQPQESRSPFERKQQPVAEPVRRNRVAHQVDQLGPNGVRVDQQPLAGAAELFVPAAQYTFGPVAEFKQHPAVRPRNLPHEPVIPQQACQRVERHIDRLGPEVGGHHPVIVLSVARIVAFVAQIVPVVADCSPAPREHQLLGKRDRLLPFADAGRSDRGLIGIPRHGDSGPLPHRQEQAVHQLPVLRKSAVLMVGVQIEKPAAALQGLLLKILPFFRAVRRHRRKAAGKNRRSGNFPVSLLAHDSHQLHILGNIEGRKPGKVRFVPDLPQADFSPVAPERIPHERTPRAVLRQIAFHDRPFRRLAEDRL